MKRVGMMFRWCFPEEFKAGKWVIVIPEPANARVHAARGKERVRGGAKKPQFFLL